jgi:hypothetical protein
MRARFHVFQYLSVPKEWKYALFNDFLEYKVLVIVTELQYIRLQQVVECEFPLIGGFSELSIVVNLLLSNICI